MNHVRSALVASLIVAAVALTGCAADSGPRPVTDDEADRIADALFENYDMGGASFAATMAIADGSSTSLTGDVDWTTKSGSAVVDATGADSMVDEVAWSDIVVAEHIPTLPDAAAQFGSESLPWAVRPLDADSYGTDTLIAVVTSLGTSTRDNPELVAQRGVQWLREDHIGGQPADVFQYGDRTRLWLAKDDVKVLRFEGNSQDGTQPILVDLVDHGPREIPLPAVTDVTQVTDISDVYTTIRGSAR